MTLADVAAVLHAQCSVFDEIASSNRYLDPPLRQLKKIMLQEPHMKAVLAKVADQAEEAKATRKNGSSKSPTLSPSAATA